MVNLQDSLGLWGKEGARDTDLTSYLTSHSIVFVLFIVVFLDDPGRTVSEVLKDKQQYERPYSSQCSTDVKVSTECLNANHRK